MTIKVKKTFHFYFLPVTFLFFSLFSYGQKEKEVTTETVKALYASMPKVDGKYEYTEIVQLDTTYKKDVLSAAVGVSINS